MKSTSVAPLYYVCMAWDSVFQEARCEDIAHAFSFSCWLAWQYQDAAIWVERQIAGERYTFAVLQGEDLSDDLDP